jgi:hypothetical protein
MLLGLQLLVARIRNNRKLFGEYVISFVFRLLSITLLQYNPLVASRIGMNSLGMLFITVACITAFEIWRYYRVWERRFDWTSYLYAQGYLGVVRKILVANPPALLRYNAASLPVVVKRAARVPVLLFDCGDQLADLASNLIAFIIATCLDKPQGLIPLFIGFSISVWIVTRPIHTLISGDDGLVDATHSMSLLYDSAVHREQNLVLERIMQGVQRHEYRRMAMVRHFWWRFIRAYAVLFVAVALMIYQTADFSRLSNLLAHCYILARVGYLLELWIRAEVPRQTAISDNSTLVELYNLPVKPMLNKSS